LINSAAQGGWELDRVDTVTSYSKTVYSFPLIALNYETSRHFSPDLRPLGKVGLKSRVMLPPNAW